jgi:exopolysaccharide biosynthesis operon protein EpsL
MPLKRYRWLVWLALALGSTEVVRAESSDDLKVIGTINVMRDSNLFRLPSTANAQALIGKPSPAETTRTTTLGLHYSKDYSLQHVELGLDMVDYRYQTFSYLNFNALNYRAAWNWSYTPHLYGNLTTSRQRALNNFADFQGFNQRNVRVDTNTRADATYELDARWRLLGSVSQFGETNQQPLIGENNYHQTVADAGVSYVLPSSSSATFKTRNTNGTNTNRPLGVVGLFDDSFTQSENEMQLYWSISEKTSADVRLSYLSHKNPSTPQRDFGGASGSARFNWAISGKSTLTAGWTRALSAYQTATTNFSQSDRFYIGPVWQISPKTKASLSLGSTVRNYTGSPSIALPLQRRDVDTDASLSFDWQPRRFVAFNASLQNARRSSNLPGLDYNSNMINLSAQFSF